MACLFATAPSFAQGVKPVIVAQITKDDPAYRAAFAESLAKPGDPAVLVRYAELAVRAGNLEGAISALERLLLIDADQPRIRLELGVLYYRLGSYQAARNYLEGARTSASAHPETRARADEFIAMIDANTTKSTFSGEVLAGLGFSTNANSGPSGSIKSLGTNIVPTPTVSSRSDFNAFTAASLHHRYDLDRQDGGQVESDLSVYASRQFQVSEANVALVDFTTGPRTSPFDGWADDMSIKPFFTGRYVAVNDLTTYWAWGIGMEASSPIGDHTTATLSILGRRREFVNNADSPTNNSSSGNEVVNTLAFQIKASKVFSFGFNTGFLRYIAMVPSESYTQIALSGSVSATFVDPLGLNGKAWLAVLNAGIARAVYDQPDPSVDPTTTRSQNDVTFSFVLGVPLDDRFTLVTQAAYTRRDASISNYAYEAFSTLAGVSLRF